MSTQEHVGVPIMRWDDWSQHPTWLTERQHAEKKLIPGGEPVAQVWWTTKYIYPDGKWLLLFDVTLAQPKIVPDKKLAAVEKAKETLRVNRTCPLCGKERSYKIEVQERLGIKMCSTCYDLHCEITQARAWLRSGVFILDTETTGLSSSSDEIVAITIRDTNGCIWADWLIKPSRPINEAGRACQINGITNEMVKDALTWAEVWPEMHSWLRGSLVLCYNVDFDRAFVRSMAHRAGLSTGGIEWDCVMKWYATYHGEWDHRRHNYRYCRLVDACYEQDVTVENAHTAGGDTAMTLALIKTIAAKPAPLDNKE